MMTQPSKHRVVVRPAFTLLEMILAASIAALLLAALYVAVDLQLRHASSARDVVEQTTLARTLLNRIGNDIAPGIATADPTRYQMSGQGSGGSGGGGSTASGGGGGATANNGAANTGGGATNANNANTGNNQGTIASTTTTTVNSFSPPTNGTSQTEAQSSPNGLAVLALQGDSTTLTLYVSRVPADPSSSQNPNDNQMLNQAQLPGVSDMRRVYYWLAPGEGLCRQEINPVTSDDAQNGNVPTGSPDPSTRQLLAREVRNLQFEYFDGENWNDTWDGTQVGSDGVTPIGPPVLVRITIGLALPNSDEVKTYRHVVAIPTANGVNAQQQSNSSDGTGSSGSGSGN
jgi:prepilin-type N-terminal cleavage/methylation domain-containing protein